MDERLIDERPIATQSGHETRAMREQLRALLDESSRPGVLAEESECGGAAAKIPDDLHELGDDPHVRLSRVRRAPLPEHG